MHPGDGPSDAGDPDLTKIRLVRAPEFRDVSELYTFKRSFYIYIPHRRHAQAAHLSSLPGPVHPRRRLSRIPHPTPSPRWQAIRSI